MTTTPTADTAAVSLSAASRQDVVAQIDARRATQAASLQRIYTYYRVVIAISLLLVFIQEIGDQLLGSLHPDGFLLTCILYLAANLLLAGGALMMPARLLERPTTTLVIAGTDIVVLTVLMHFSGGVSSGIGTLMLVSVAAGAILISGRASLALAALATIALLYEELYLSLIPMAPGEDWFQAGILGLLFFGTAAAIDNLSLRLRRTEITSLQRAAEVATLERLNNLIIQRMHTGIVVATATGGVRLMNQSALALLGINEAKGPPDTLGSPLSGHLAHWRNDPDFRPAPFQTADSGIELRVNFSSISDDQDTDVILFLEDATELQQQAQQLKLAALGRLSASIAHEIRNPLGAISHAAQLLKESDNLDKADHRLTDIIQNHSKRMNGVIENILELSRRRAPDPQLLVLRDWLDKFAGEYSEGAPEATIDVAVDPKETVVRVDPSQMGQVLTNLVQNGLRYSEQASGNAQVELRGGIDLTTERPFLHVVDTGPGVPADKVQNLFEPFFTTEATGTGLGLYISREMCEANHARLSWAPNPDGGSIFRITFSHPNRIVNSTD